MIAFSTIQHSQSAGATDHWNPNWLLAVIKQRLLYYDDVKWLDKSTLRRRGVSGEAKGAWSSAALQAS